MSELIPTIYEWFPYSGDLGTHLRGMDVDCESFTGTDFYTLNFFYMLGIIFIQYVLFYHIIDRLTTIFNRFYSWWIIALIGFAINFGIAYSLPTTVDVCESLDFSSLDLVFYGLANAIWGLLLYAVFTSIPLTRYFSINTRNTTFYKP